MLKCLNISITHYNVKQNNNLAPSSCKGDQLEHVVLHYPNQKVMLTFNLWIAVDVINRSLEKIVSIFYDETLPPPKLPTFVVVNFCKYVALPWDPNNPIYLSIPPIERGSHI